MSPIGNIDTLQYLIDTLNLTWNSFVREGDGVTSSKCTHSQDREHTGCLIRALFHLLGSWYFDKTVKVKTSLKMYYSINKYIVNYR